jgi:hypothetical protein
MSRHKLRPAWKQTIYTSRPAGIDWIQTATFEDGALTPNPTGWDSVTNGNGGFSVSSSSPLSGSNSCVAVIDANLFPDVAYLTGPVAATDKFISIEFLYEEVSVTMGAGEGFGWLRIGTAAASAVDVNRLEGIDGNQFIITLDSGSVSINWGSISAGVHKVNLDVKISDAPGANNGYVALYVDDVFVGAQTGLDNDTKQLDLFGLRMSGWDAGTAVTIKLDDIRWARESAVGYSP